MVVALIFLFTIPLQLVPVAPDDGIQLCLSGCFHAGEIPADFSAQWYGLFHAADNDAYQIRAVKPKVVPCSDPVFDTDEDTLSGREILIDDTSGNPVVLIGGIDLEEGNIETSFLNHPRCLFPGDYIRFHLNSVEYALMATGSVAFDTTGKRMIPYIRNYRLLLVKNMYHEPVVQELFVLEQLYASEEVQPSLFFAGDIDRDGKPDLLFNLSTHYNVSNVTLFLSGNAAAGRLVKKAASWNTTGC